MRQSSGLSSAACWPFAMLLGHTALSLYLTPRVTVLPLCGRLRCTEWAAAAAAGGADNDQQSNALCISISLSLQYHSRLTTVVIDTSYYNPRQQDAFLHSNCQRKKKITNTGKLYSKHEALPVIIKI